MKSQWSVFRFEQKGSKKLIEEVNEFFNVGFRD
jgi:hypothetical protein